MNELLPQLVKWIKPKDGLVVNADVWSEAHSFHRLHQLAHLYYGHGPGIITGLEVRLEQGEAEVQPGMALDSSGRLVVLEEPMSFEIGGDQAGLVYLYLQGDSESETDGSGDNTKPHYAKIGYSLDSGLSLPVDAVELGRVRLLEPDHPIRIASNPDLPAPHELDLRFRPEIGAADRVVVSVAICYLGKPTDQGLPRFGLQAGYLARALSHLTRWRIYINDEVALSHELRPYTMLYLVEHGPHQLERAETEALQAYRQAGGTILLESYQSDSPLLKQLDVTLKTVLTDQVEPLLNEPFLFSAPPPGANQGVVYLGDGIIFSTCDYGRLWQRRDPLLSRESLRVATEWAANIIAYAVRDRPGRSKQTDEQE